MRKLQKKKKYSLKLNKKQVAILKEAWKQFESDYDVLWRLIKSTEKWMQKETGIKDLEFIEDTMFGGEWTGIGNCSRTMKLYRREDLV